MKYYVIFFLALLTPLRSMADAPITGFSLPDSIQKLSLHYRSIDNLIILPVTINDSIHLNLILDTGTRNVVLFGKKFRSRLSLEKNKKIKFSGVGKGSAAEGDLSLENKVRIDAIVGNRIPVIIVTNKNILSSYPGVDGIIGYDIFQKFEVELNFSRKMISFRPGNTSTLGMEYDLIPLKIIDVRPTIATRIILPGGEERLFDLLIDTGSILGLMITRPKPENKTEFSETIILGRGLNGVIEGIETKSESVWMENFEMKNIRTGIVYSTTHDYASVGVDVLKDFILILNYCKSYAGLKKNIP